MKNEHFLSAFEVVKDSQFIKRKATNINRKKVMTLEWQKKNYWTRCMRTSILTNLSFINYGSALPLKRISKNIWNVYLLKRKHSVRLVSISKSVVGKNIQTLYQF